MIKRTFATLAVLALASSALADSKTASTQASLSYLPECNISTSDIDMGIYNSRTGATGEGIATIKCNTEFFAYYSGFTGNLTKGIDQIPYGLSYSIYWSFLPRLIDQPDSASKAARAFEWGNINTNYLPTQPNSVGSNPTIYYLHANVAPGLWKPAGTYSEIVTFNLDFPISPCVTYNICS
jgi:hypothetical protein